MEGMKEYPDGYFDLAVVDPPYGIGFDGNTTVKGNAGKANTFSNTQHHVKKEWDAKRTSSAYFAELRRISKNQIIWGGNYYADLLPPKKGWIFWDKKITNANNSNFSDGELAWSSFDCILKRFTYDWIGFGYLNNLQREKKIHPTQKPVALYLWLLNNYAKPGDLILDTHVGSASSLIACEKLGFNYVGYELDKDYYKAACDRLNEFRLQVDMFIDKPDPVVEQERLDL